MLYLMLFVLTSIPLFTTASVCGALDDTSFSVHGNAIPMTTPSPFSIVTSASTTHQRETLTIRIKSILSSTFNSGGFIVHAVSTTRPDRALGRFIPSTVGLQLSNCDGEDNVATFHGYPGADGEIELQWQAPGDYVGEILFNATIAQDYDTFWVGIQSNPVKILLNEVLSLKSFFSSLVARVNATNIANQLPLVRAEVATNSNANQLPVVSTEVYTNEQDLNATDNADQLPLVSAEVDTNERDVNATNNGNQLPLVSEYVYTREKGVKATNNANQLPLVSSEPRNSALIYQGCGSTKTCFGFPADCVESRTCQGIATATFSSNRFIFELSSNAAGVSYVALGLSRDGQMGDDSVVECIRDGNDVRVYTSWNLPRTNHRVGVPQNIISLIRSSLTDGTIYCEFERDASSTILGTVFDLNAERFHFQTCLGSNIGPDAITHHNLGRVWSTTPLGIIRQSIYNGCGDTKTCFGMPIGCIEAHSCQAIVAATITEDEQYEFEMQSGVANAGYISFALSADELMGDDSVIECIREDGVVRAYHSWNNQRPSFTNTRVDVPQTVITLLDSSYTDGIIYCKVRRQGSITVRDTVFDLTNNHFYYLLAIGTSFTADTISIHNLGRESSTERLLLPGRSSAPYAVRISAVTIVVWFLATNCAHFFHRL